MTLREKLIVLRDKAGITQMALAHQLGVSRQAVTRWESGDTTPSMDKLKALAKIYGVSLDWLCSESDMADEKPVEVVELTLCTSYAVDTVLDSMPGVTIVPGGIPLSGVGWVMLLVGGIIIAYNLLKK